MCDASYFVYVGLTTSMLSGNKNVELRTITVCLVICRPWRIIQCTKSWNRWSESCELTRKRCSLCKNVRFVLFCVAFGRRSLCLKKIVLVAILQLPIERYLAASFPTLLSPFFRNARHAQDTVSPGAPHAFKVIRAPLLPCPLLFRGI